MAEIGGPPEIPPRPPEALDREAKEIGGPTLFSNRFLVQSYPDGSVRLIFAEQFSPWNDQPPAFRGAFFVDRSSALHLLQQLSQALGMTIAPLEPEATDG